MRASKARPADSILLIVDIQTRFMENVWEAERVVRRSEFLLQIANLLDIPAMATEQNPSRMSSTSEGIASSLAHPPFEKMSFSACGCTPFADHLETLGRRQIILVGVETHICVSQTAVDLLNLGYEVMVCPDAVSSRTVEMHKLGMERLRDSGILPIHSEAVAYEWMGSADHPRFREALKIVKGE